MSLISCPFCKTKLSPPIGRSLDLNEIKTKFYLECLNGSCERWFKVVFKSFREKAPTTVTFFVPQNNGEQLYVWFWLKENGIFELSIYRCTTISNRKPPKQILSVDVDGLPDFANISDFEKKIESMLIFA